MSIQIDISTWVKNKNYPEWMDEIAVSMISKGYLLPDEDVFDAFKRVSKSAARRLKRKDLQPYFYEAIVKNWLCLASPVLSNMGTERGMPISCFGIDVGDSIEGKDPKALKLWGEILKTRLETGEPYIMFEDNVNKANPEAYKNNNLQVSMTNICSEISLYTDELHSFICCLSSLNLARWDEWKDYKFENGMTLPELTCWFLEGVLQEFIDRAKNIKFMENTVRSATKGRAIGIGVLGWHTLLQSKELPFVGIQASSLTRIISEFIYNEALKASQDQAKEYGEPEWCKGTGLRHTHHIAIAPTVSNAHISGGVSPSIEPIPANVYNLKTAKGVFIKRNKILENLLEKKGYNIDSVWDQILKDQGSVYGLPDYILSDEEKEIFLTFKEINQLEISNFIEFIF